MYSREENVGEELLSRVHRGRYRSDGYVWHATLKEVRACVFDWICVGLYREGGDRGLEWKEAGDRRGN